ncbi:MAG: hypothetical protein Kapaf2KO_12440 [Candidatus Kapaibacteriales bacterium]
MNLKLILLFIFILLSLSCEDEKDKSVSILKTLKFSYREVSVDENYLQYIDSCIDRNYPDSINKYFEILSKGDSITLIPIWITNYKAYQDHYFCKCNSNYFLFSYVTIDSLFEFGVVEKEIEVLDIHYYLDYIHTNATSGSRAVELMDSLLPNFMVETFPIKVPWPKDVNH